MIILEWFLRRSLGMQTGPVIAGPCCSMPSGRAIYFLAARLDQLGEPALLPRRGVGMDQPLPAGAIEQLHGLVVRGLRASAPAVVRTFLMAVRSWLRWVRLSVVWVLA